MCSSAKVLLRSLKCFGKLRAEIQHYTDSRWGEGSEEIQIPEVRALASEVQIAVPASLG